MIQSYQCNIFSTHFSHTATSFTSLKHPGLFGRKRHKKDYESLAPFKFHCSMCSFKSKRKSHYLKHLLVHSKKSLPVLQCAQCSFTTIRLSHLRRHQLTHSAQVYHCKVCNYKTDDVKRLNRHHRIKHVTGPVEPEVQEVRIDWFPGLLFPAVGYTCIVF